MDTLKLLTLAVGLAAACTPKTEAPATEDSSTNKSWADKLKDETEQDADDRNGASSGGGVDPEERKAKLAKIPAQTTLDLAEECHRFSDFRGKESAFRFVNTRVNWYTANGKSTPSGGNSDEGGSATCASACGSGWRLFTEKEVEAYDVPIDVIIDGKEIESGYGMNSWTSSVGFGSGGDSEDGRVSSAAMFQLGYFQNKVKHANPDSLNYLLCRKG